MLVACSGLIEKKAVVENDEIVIRDMMNVVYTMDHRFGDAALGIKFLNIIRDYVEDPDNFNADKYQAAPPYNEPVVETKKTN
jgi:pyruvate/2-oxoglutarate dehydrogenase complex dihydrolipoamide acyltransferase (E2) component